eukprot:gb/GECG01011375.1/.p1 GENE.gb/GECG01011375.1/~~gb/GECG01011375.1/.p1  ORF type:complete len:559 (+),score=66.02 gb/GECG01011375.1/:1-1677(+)
MYGVPYRISEGFPSHTVAWVLGTAFLATLVAVLIKHWKLTKQYPGEAPVVREGLPLLGSAPEFGKAPLQLLHRLEKQYGSIFTCVLAGARMTFITNAHDGRAFIRNTGSRKDIGTEMKNKEICKHLFGHDMDKCTRTWGVDQDHIHRLHTVGLLNPKSLTEISSRMCRMMQQEIKSKLTKEHGSWTSASMYDFVTRLVFSAASKSLFSDENGVDWEHDVYDHFGTFDRAIASLLMFGEKLLYIHPSVAHARRKLWSVLGTLSGKQGSTYVRKRVEHYEGKQLPEEELGSAQLTIFWASHSNSLPAIYWTMAHTLNTPGLLERVRKEAIDVVNAASGRSSSTNNLTVTEALELLGHVSSDDLKKMAVLDSVFSEILRLYAANFVFRQAPNPATLPLDTTAISVRQNDSVAVYASTIHYDNEIFPDPFTFQWDRFYDEGSGGCKKFYKDGREVRYPLFAFGGGETMCKGRYFVRNENKIAFLAILIALDVEMYHKDDVNERGELKASTSPNNIPEGKFPVSNTKAGGSGIVPPLDKDALVIRFRRRHGDEAIDGKRGMHQ